MAKIEVLSPGLFSTIQDLGRHNFRKYGVPISGAMDMFSAKMANLILQNSEDYAVLEITQMGPKLKFHSAAKIGITGANLSPKINDEEIQNDQVYFLEEGDELSFGKRVNGCRTYLSISGGFKTETILESKSWYEGISENIKLEKGMILYFQDFEQKDAATNASVKVNSKHVFETKIELEEGPEFYKLSTSTKEEIKNRFFTIDKNNSRMAIQLTEKLKNELLPIITSPVVPGTVQLTPSGNLIVLMRDCQTTGGYPRILQLTENGINTMSQKIMGDQVMFSFKDFGN
ncbi:biotin-dependent carboxylase uncharacterized domain-containing protein [Gillisia sp. Hel1_33_143]|uniref:5-oxoprolinase subunit C family protein n=1 Tax=Gillisia sp. Hel1_33_143 TaxID=1336796 RepID=UPI00087CF115|nr:biotin-dependent carboxyltransferase family protein [Gillisia sp. Hel1_33_143]SDS82647.1 biotin-dependent carboxylase uncharacterized domain-containing protein [Gillisia sp. Hel1_33_143]